MSSPDIEDRLRRTLAVVADRVVVDRVVADRVVADRVVADRVVADRVAGQDHSGYAAGSADVVRDIGASSRRGARRRPRAMVVAAAILLLVAAGAVAVARSGDDVVLQADPSFSGPMEVATAGATVRAEVVVGGGRRCLVVSAADGSGAPLEVRDRGDVACLPIGATGDVAAATASIVAPRLTVVSGLAGGDYRSLGASFAAGSGPNQFEQLTGVVPAILVVIAHPPGSDAVFEGALLAHRDRGPAVKVPIRRPADDDAPRCLAADGAEVCIDDAGRISARGLMPGSELHVQPVLGPPGPSTAPQIVGHDGSLSGAWAFLSLGGIGSGFAVEVVASTAVGGTLAGTIAVG